MKRLLIAFLGLSVLLAAVAVGLVAYVASKSNSTKHAALLQLKKDVTRDLHDPESVRFRDLKLVTDSDHLEGIASFIALVQKDGTWVMKTLRERPMSLFTYRSDAFALCGQLNAKNRMGAYVGYTDFYVAGTDPTKPFVVIEGLGWDKKFISDMCSIGTVVLQPPDDAGAK